MKVDLYEIGKRFLDIIGGFVGLVLFSPLLIAGAIWVKIVSPEGPVFADIPNRVGKNKKPFKLYKIRSMIPDAHNFMLNNPEMRKLHRDSGYKLDPDPRLLKGAKFIRKFSIDEMPQFFNILVGDMSIVGPRAYYYHEVEEQLEKHPQVRDDMEVALSIKPGLTGVWQTSGRSEVPFEKRVEMDAEYAKKRSLIFDILIILKTPYVVITGKGAF